MKPAPPVTRRFMGAVLACWFVMLVATESN
jgi:hypothetical protein